MGQQLIDRHFGHQVKENQTFQDDKVHYRLIEDDDSTALNAGETSQCQARPAGELGEDIRRLILKIYSAFLSADGKVCILLTLTGLGGHICPSMVRDWKDMYVPLL